MWYRIQNFDFSTFKDEPQTIQLGLNNVGLMALKMLGSLIFNKNCTFKVVFLKIMCQGLQNSIKTYFTVQGSKTGGKMDQFGGKYKKKN